MSKSWGAITSWAAEAEAEEQEQAAAAAASSADSQSFPSLKEAVSTKQKKKKMTLQEFTMGTRAAPAALGRRDSASDHKGLTPDEMMRLPTGPKERSPEEMQYGRLGGGGFSTYGRSGGFPGRRDRGDSGDGDTSWGGGGGRRSYGGGFDEDRRQPPLHRSSDFDQPSRADEVDNWAMAKKPLQSYDSGPTRPPNRYGSLGAGEGMSRADEVDSWAAGKKPIPASSARYSSSTTSSSSTTTFGASTFRNTGPEPERWSSGGGVDQERPKLVLQARSEAAALSDAPKANKPSPFGAARPREEVLAEKGLDWKKIDLEIDAKKTSRPTSSQSSRPSSAQSNRSEGQGLQGGVVEGASKLRPKVNPFGDAKPRELLLEEKGMDWRKIDLGLEEYRSGGGVGRSESDAEKNLKREIDNLKKELEKVSAPNGNGEAQLVGSAEQKKKKELENLIISKEKELEVLMNELDDKARSSQKHVERPGSGAGRVSGIPERPPSQSGRYEESRNVAAAAFMDRPRSRGRGGGDAWTRQGDDRRSFRGGGGGGGRETGFLGNNRDMDRSRERW